MIHRNQFKISTCEPSGTIKTNNGFKDNKKMIHKTISDLYMRIT